eukprot:3079092-Prymnesium_polylepis.2
MSPLSSTSAPLRSLSCRRAVAPITAVFAEAAVACTVDRRQAVTSASAAQCPGAANAFFSFLSLTFEQPKPFCKIPPLLQGALSNSLGGYSLAA